MLPLRSVLILLTCFSVISLDATNYYLSSKGNDSFSGTSIARAWRSLARLNAMTYAAGDSLFLEGSAVFQGTIYLSPLSNGTPGNPIYVGSYGSGIATVQAGDSSGFLAYNNAGISLNHLKIEGNGYVSNKGYGILFYMDLSGDQVLSGISINHCEISGFRKAGIQVLAYPNDAGRSGYREVSIEHCIAHHNGAVGISVQGNFKTHDTLYNHRKVRVRDCVVHHNDGLSGGASHSGNGILLGQVDSGWISRCEAYENGKNNDFASAGPAGIWAWDSKFITIEYCYSHHNRSKTADGDGFDLDGGVQNSVMQYNYSHDNDGPGLLVAQFQGARKMKNNVIRYNISENDGKGLGALIWSGDPGSSVTAENIDFYNNVVVVDSVSGKLADAAFAVYNNYGSTRNIRVCNNILMARNKGFLVDVHPTPGLKFYNNAYWDFGEGFRFKDNGVEYTSLNAWRQASSQEWVAGKRSGFTANPKLVNPGNEGSIPGVDHLDSIRAYQLLGQSPLIGKGIYFDSLIRMGEVLHDFYGDSISQLVFTPGVQNLLLPVPSFSAKDKCTDDQVQFLNNSSRAESYQWFFGDGNSSTQNHPEHAYRKAGEYVVTLLAKGKNGYVDSLKRTIRIWERPRAYYTANNVCPGDSVHISNQSMDATSYYWESGNAQSSQATEPVISYTDSGTYNLTLIAMQSAYCSDTFVDQIVVYPKPKALFSIGNACQGDSVRIENHSNGDINHWLNGSDTFIDNSKAFELLFAEVGKHPLQLILHNDKNCLDSLTLYTETFARPEPEFSVEPVCEGEPSLFMNQTDAAVRYKWKLTEKDSTDMENPQFIFDSAGTYTVMLSALDANSCSGSHTREVIVHPIPSTKFTYLSNGNSLHLKASEDSSVLYRWMIGDTVYVGREIDVYPTESGNISVKLELTNRWSCSATGETEVPFTRTGIDGQPDFRGVKLYPNPFGNQLHIGVQSENGSPLKLSVYDMKGQLISTLFLETGSAEQGEFSLGQDVFKEAGLYLLIIESASEREVYKVVNCP